MKYLIIRDVVTSEQRIPFTTENFADKDLATAMEEVRREVTSISGRRDAMQYACISGTAYLTRTVDVLDDGRTEVGGE